MEPKDIDDMVKCKPFAAERLLKSFQIKVTQLQQRKFTQKTQNTSREPVQPPQTKPSTTSGTVTARMKRPSSASSTRVREKPQQFDDFEDAPSSHRSNHDDDELYNIRKTIKSKVNNQVKEQAQPQQPVAAFEETEFTFPKVEDLELFREKDAKIHELEETVKLLESKINKLQLLLRLKDSKIQALNNKIKV